MYTTNVSNAKPKTSAHRQVSARLSLKQQHTTYRYQMNHTVMFRMVYIRDFSTGSQNRI